MTDEPTPDAPTDEVDVTIQPTLPTLELPAYYGRKPIGMKTSVNGAGNRLSKDHEIGERVVLVIDARVKKAGHEQTDDGLVYTEVLKVEDLFEVQGDPGKRLLATVRNAYRESDDTRTGRAALEADGVTLATAADGVVLTPAELAARRGDPAAALVDEAMTPVVVVYSDGARELWPDEFEAGSPRPNAGEKFEIEGQEGPTAYAYVKELLHAETGETLAAWTEEQEADRLLAMEDAALADEEDPETEKAGPAYFKIEHENGSISEVDFPPDFATLNGEDRVIMVRTDGTETVMQRPTSDLAPLATEAPLPGEDGYDDGLEPMDKPEPEFVEDEDGFADVVQFPAQPTPDDFVLVDTDLPGLELNLSKCEDIGQARRMLEAEKQGRGRKLKTRKGAIDAILARIAALEVGGGEQG